MRNGDYIPTRLEAQHDAANFLVGAKTQSNPENTVGVIAMCGGTSFSGSGGGSSPGELLVSPTDDMAKILSALHGIPIRKGCQSRNFANDNDTEEEKKMDNIGKGGGVDLIVSLQVANLALKHRRNKNGEQRVIVFVGSPLTHVDSRALTRAGRMLKKNNLAIDVIAMGELEENEEKLKDLVDAANRSSSSEDGGERTCHLVTIPAGVLPSDVLVSSPIVHGGGGGMGSSGGGGISAGGSGGGGGAGGFAEFGGVDPNMDPELAMALRVSMEEERARQERAAAAAAQESNNDGSNNATEEDGDGAAMEVDSSAAAVNATTATEDVGFEVSEEDALLQQALAMSMTNGNDTSTTSAAPATETTTAAAASTTNTSPPDEDMIDEEDEDAAMQLALQMSMQPDAEDDTTPPKADEAASSQQFQDPQFVNQLLGTLPSGESNDAVRNILDKNKKDGDDDNDADKK